MTGVKLTDLPLAPNNILLDTDQFVVARGDSTRRLTGASFVKPADVSALTTNVSILSSSTINVSQSPTVLLTYTPETRNLQAEVLIIPPNKGGTGFTSYINNHILLGTTSGVLERRVLQTGDGISLAKTEDGNLTITNTKAHSATNLSQFSDTVSITIQSSTGSNTILSPASKLFAGIMSAVDKSKLDTLWDNPSIVVSENFRANAFYNRYTVFVNSPTEKLVTLASDAPIGTKIDFIKVGEGDVKFVSELNIPVVSSPNSTYNRISEKFVIVTAERQNLVGWHLSGKLSAEYSRILVGPKRVDTVQKVNFTTNNFNDVLYYKGDWNKTTLAFESMTVLLSGQSRAVIDFTSDRLGSLFYYRQESPLGIDTVPEEGPEFYGIFQTSQVSLTALPPKPTAYPLATPLATSTPAPTPTIQGPTSTPAPTPTQSSTPTETPTPTASSTETPTPTPTNSSTPTPTTSSTETPTPTASSTETPTPTPTL